MKKKLIILIYIMINYNYIFKLIENNYMKIIIVILKKIYKKNILNKYLNI